MYSVIKRGIDILLSLLGMLIFSPLFLILMIAIRIDSVGPILFKQKRIGKHKRTFMIYKFRTMRHDTPKDIPTHLLKDPKSYITKMGEFLRKTSLDELPQLINILKGEMSVVGPRPALWNQDDLIRERDKVNANSILPGLTGWAQVNGRDELAIAIKAQYDGEYVKRMSLLFDIKIFFLTILKVVQSDGVKEGRADQ
jgi:O-antigen biosynthesis protein WbqP